MSDQPFLRYFCHILPEAPEGAPPGFGDLSFAYFEALRGTGAPIRVLACNAQAHLQTGRWSSFDHEFIRSIPSSYINIICGDNGELVRLFTVGTANIAITASYNGEPTADEVATLKNFDAVICPTTAEVEIYRRLGVGANLVEASAAAMAPLLRGHI